ncbi:MAG: outer membrane protein assembly factor BamE [Yoonia sp.]|nr:outer membrane protein assembly factor BamE [Yoonia sp.]
MATSAIFGKSIIQRSVAVLALMVAVACTPIIRNHGYMPPEEDLALIAVGVDTRDTVTTTIGPPASGGVLSESGFYYVASKFRHFGAYAPEEIEREVLAISFDAGGVVSNIERFGLQDGNVVVLSRRVTDNQARDSTFIRQLMSSFGRVNASDFLGEN